MINTHVLHGHVEVLLKLLEPVFYCLAVIPTELKLQGKAHVQYDVIWMSWIGRLLPP